MYYLIDGNNLAGKLKLLAEEDFGQKLISLIKKTIGNKKIVLVFDSTDPMGDKYVDGAMTVVYSPKDNYYHSADDKILEIFSSNREECILVTDDIELIGKMKNFSLEKGTKLSVEKASDFAEKIKFILEIRENGNEKELSLKDEEELNKELLNIWK